MVLVVANVGVGQRRGDELRRRVGMQIKIELAVDPAAEHVEGHRTVFVVDGDDAAVQARRVRNLRCVEDSARVITSTHMDQRAVRSVAPGARGVLRRRKPVWTRNKHVFEAEVHRPVGDELAVMELAFLNRSGPERVE